MVGAGNLWLSPFPAQHRNDVSINADENPDRPGRIEHLHTEDEWFASGLTPHKPWVYALCEYDEQGYAAKVTCYREDGEALGHCQFEWSHGIIPD